MLGPEYKCFFSENLEKFKAVFFRSGFSISFKKSVTELLFGLVFNSVIFKNDYILY